MLDFLAADRALLAKKDAEIQELEAQVSALERSLSLLHAARRIVQQRLCSYKYPVLTLPNEIVAEIFLRFLPPYPDVPPPLSALSPIHLTHICHQWREIAHKTPGLWRAIDLSPRNADRLLLSSERTISLTGLWVSRSGNCPLSIRMESDRDPLSILAPLIPHRDRWEHLTLRLETTQALSSIQGPFPLLKSLDLQFGSTVSDDEVVTLQAEDLPLLSTVVLDDFGIPHISLPWSQLTSITLMWIYSEDCMSILRQTTHLVRCTLHLWIQHGPENNVVDLVLPHLETLDVEADDTLHTSFLQCLVAPALHYLRLPEHLLQPNVIESLNSFISRSGCHLDELKITTGSVSRNAYRNAFPAITDVWVDIDSDSDSN